MIVTESEQGGSIAQLRAAGWKAALSRIFSSEALPAMVYQPIINLRRAHVVGYEALARFPSPPSAPPDVWFEEARKLGCGDQLEALTLNVAMQAWPRLPRQVFLAINVSPGFLGSERWEEFLRENASLERLVFEVSERQAIADYQRLRPVIDEIRRRGGSFAVDDAGSDLASLRTLIELHPDYIKLDRAFITGCHADPAKSAAIEMVRRLSRKLKAGVIAEGLETTEELDELLRLDTPLAQGFLFARPSAAWTGVDPEVSMRMLSQRATEADHCRVSAALEQIPVFRTDQAAVEHITLHPEVPLVAVVDAMQRVSALIDMHPAEGLRLLDRPLVAKRNQSAPEVLLTAIARPHANRFDPVAVVETSGEFAGVARMENLIQASLGKTCQDAQQQLTS